MEMCRVHYSVLNFEVHNNIKLTLVVAKALELKPKSSLPIYQCGVIKKQNVVLIGLILIQNGERMKEGEVDLVRIMHPWVMIKG